MFSAQVELNWQVMGNTSVCVCVCLFTYVYVCWTSTDLMTLQFCCGD